MHILDATCIAKSNLDLLKKVRKSVDTLNTKFKTKFLIEVTDDMEILLVIPEDFRKEHGTNLYKEFVSCYQVSDLFLRNMSKFNYVWPFYETLYKGSTDPNYCVNCYFDKKQYVNTKHLCVSYGVITHGIDTFISKYYKQ